MNPHLYDQALSKLESDNIFFVSIGAMDGIAHDSLYPHAFKNKHWSGLLVEPVKHYFDKLKSNYEHRANLIFENVAVTNTPGIQTIYSVDPVYVENGTVPYWCDGISTFNLDSTIKHFQDKTIAQHVSCCTVADLIAKHNILHIDVLQIDAEGWDFDIFQQVFVLGFRPKIVHIEVVHLSKFERQQLEVMLIQCGYELNAFGDNLTATKTIVTTFPKRKRIAFYTYTQWAFGSIHTALCKELYPYGIDADIIDWNLEYSAEEWQDFRNMYDSFVTVPGKATAYLLSFGVPYEKIIAIAHGKFDLQNGIEYKNDFNAFKGFAGVAQSMVQTSMDLGITRPLATVRNGIQFDRFYQPVATKLSNLGYASSIKFHGDDCKRTNLLQRISTITNLPIIYADKKNFLGMPQFYSTIDSIVVSSNATESCALPLMEAAAAGRLPISAKIGIASEFDDPPGIILPLEDEAFVCQGVKNILELTYDTNKFQQLCKEAQDFAHDFYDWQHVIQGWVKVLNG